MIHSNYLGTVLSFAIIITLTIILVLGTTGNLKKSAKWESDSHSKGFHALHNF